MSFCLRCLFTIVARYMHSISVIFRSASLIEWNPCIFAPAESFAQHVCAGPSLPSLHASVGYHGMDNHAGLAVRTAVNARDQCGWPGSLALAMHTGIRALVLCSSTPRSCRRIRDRSALLPLNVSRRVDRYQFARMSRPVNGSTSRWLAKNAFDRSRCTLQYLVPASCAWYRHCPYTVWPGQFVSCNQFYQIKYN